ncbi:hypothetical protein LguiA_002996 [Lonicera macranthoides]
MCFFLYDMYKVLDVHKPLGLEEVVVVIIIIAATAISVCCRLTLRVQCTGDCSIFGLSLQ